MTEVIPLSDDWYGPRTDAIKRILRQVLDISWFTREPSGTEQATISQLIQAHLLALRKFAPDTVPSHAAIHWLRGDWELLHQNQWGIDPYEPWGEQWKSTNEVLGLIIQKIRSEIMSDPIARSLFRPPLWPMEGNCNICGEPLVACQEMMATQLAGC